jgi:RHS repeat-associated protein
MKPTMESTRLTTDLGYTGQRNYAYINLLDYGARWYSSALGRFTQPDSIVPDLTDTQAWNRFAYVQNNPIRYNDPTGHILGDPNDPESCPDGICPVSEDLNDDPTEDNTTNDPYKDVQDYTAGLAERAGNGEIDDLEAMLLLLRYAILRAQLSYGADEIDRDILMNGLFYAASSFWREDAELLTYGLVRNYRYERASTTSYRFGVSGFDEMYFSEGNTNQIEHFIGESAVMASLGASESFGRWLAKRQDSGDDAASTADRELGYLAAWWVGTSQRDPANTLTYLDEVIDAIRTGGGITSP